MKRKQFSRSELPTNNEMRRFSAPRPFHLLSRVPILRHCDAFVTNFTAAEFLALYCCVRPLSLFYSNASADGAEERSLVPRSRSHAWLKRNATRARLAIVQDVDDWRRRLSSVLYLAWSAQGFESLKSEIRRLWKGMLQQWSDYKPDKNIQRSGDLIRVEGHRWLRVA
ncbi:hypothetical protein EVAR_43096_1 [Eumeta japonica]|uniref:Uncharacterized protein n=1 Tax=Eumeta variegata TaxID=151549 RepID=A0A4C1WWS8_EUMVA|nr:hypothetical protein EVAR_43096_1 [Eumeta japonica]